MPIIVDIVAQVLVALGILIVLVLSDILPAIINIARPRDAALQYTEEIAAAYPCVLARLAACRLCQSVQALLVAWVVVGAPGWTWWASLPLLLVAWTRLAGWYRRGGV